MDRIDPETVHREAEQARSRGIDRDVRALLRWAWTLLGERLMMSTAFGKSGMVILHVLREEVPEVPVYFLDTGFHFPETLEFAEALRERWNIRLVLQRPELYGPDFVRKFGEKLYDRDPDLCCHKNKVEPFRELIGDNGRFQGWITGVRRDQATTRAHAEPIEVLENDIVKIQPLAYWTRQEVEEYLREHEIPLHPLLSQGYASVGCAPCTRKAACPTNERAGRWAGKAKTECGLHTFWKRNGKLELPQRDASKEKEGETTPPASRVSPPRSPASPSPPARTTG